MSIIVANIDYVKMANELGLIKLNVKKLNDMGIINIHTIEIENSIREIVQILDDGVSPHVLKAIKPGG